MMGGTIHAIGEAGPDAQQDDRQVGNADIDLDLLEATRRDVGADSIHEHRLSGGRQSAGDTHHVLFGYADIDDLRRELRPDLVQPHRPHVVRQHDCIAIAPRDIAHAFEHCIPEIVAHPESFSGLAGRQ